MYVLLIINMRSVQQSTCFYVCIFYLCFELLTANFALMRFRFNPQRKNVYIKLVEGSGGLDKKD